jgi:hypothetical protein
VAEGRTQGYLRQARILLTGTHRSRGHLTQLCVTTDGTAPPNVSLRRRGEASAKGREIRIYAAFSRGVIWPRRLSPGELASGCTSSARFSSRTGPSPENGPRFFEDFKGICEGD